MAIEFTLKLYRLGFTRFIIEEYIPNIEQEYYLCIVSVIDGDVIYFSSSGGVDINVDTAKKYLLEFGASFPSFEDLCHILLADVDPAKQLSIYNYIERIYSRYSSRHFTFLEINPLVCLIQDGIPKCFCLDVAGKLDSDASFLCEALWNKGNTIIKQTLQIVVA